MGRKSVLVFLVISAVLLAGCSNRMERSVGAAEVDGTVLEETGYVEADRSDREDRMSGGYGNHMVLNGKLVEYRREEAHDLPVETDQPLTHAGVFTTSTAIPDQPLGLDGVNELVEHPERTYADLAGDVLNLTVHVDDRIDRRNVTHNGTGASMLVEKYEVRFDLDDYLNAEGYMVTGMVEVEDTMIMAYGAYPGWVNGTEDRAVRRMVRHTRLSGPDT